MSTNSLVVVGLIILIISCFGEVIGSNACDKLGILIYEDIGCKPVTKPGAECPIRYECDLAVRNNTCLFRGNEILVGQSAPDNLTYSTCDVGCRCVKGFPAEADFEKYFNNEPVSIPGNFNCAILDCPEWLGGSPLKPGCHRTYHLDKCCSVGQKCSNEKPTPGVCHVDGETVLEGQKFYPKNTCSKCICPHNFNGKYEHPHCNRAKCNAQIRRQGMIQNYCAPFYFAGEDEVLCCPQHWVCPSPTDKIVTLNHKAADNSDLTCRFGTKYLKLGEGLESKIKDYDSKEYPSKCECILPPFLTCKGVKA